MGDSFKSVCAKFVCREAQIRQLYELYGYKNEALIDCVYIFGSSSTGKSAITTELLENTEVKHVVINLIECYTSKILFETVLNSLMDYTVDPTTGQPYAKCDNLMNFISHLRQFSKTTNLEQSVIVLDKAERLREMDFNLLPAFLRFRELSGLSISFILISELEFTKLVPKTGVSPPIEIYFPQYTKDELHKIMLLDFIDSNVDSDSEDPRITEKDFYSNYLNIFLSVFYRVCRDLSELRYLAKKNFTKYCEPVLNGEIKLHDSTKLFRNIAPILKASLDTVYLRMNTANNEYFGGKTANEQLALHGLASLQTSKMQAQFLELPFYAKYLLIAAYLASYNPAKEDKRLFMKYHGKKTKTKHQINAKAKVSEQMNTQLGPKPFTFDRLLAIFYAILEDQVGLNSNLLVQVSSLVQLQLLSSVGDSANLENHKYKCNVSFEFIQTVAKMVGFNIRKYLYDFI